MPSCNKGQLAGIISGGSAAYATAPRDAFFGITSENRDKALNGIIDNTVFRMVNHERNLATRGMSLWRKVVPLVWQHLYGVVPFGFETFVVEEDQRKGALYKGDNWTAAGQTVGSAKSHVGLTERFTRILRSGTEQQKSQLFRNPYFKLRPAAVVCGRWRPALVWGVLRE